MNFEKAIALFLALVLAVYSYTAFFEMDYLLPPILQRNPVWPSTFPKILSVMGLIACALVFLNIEKSEKQVGDDLDISNWRAYKIIHAFSLIFGMVVYALVLRPLGFIGANIWHGRLRFGIASVRFHWRNFYFPVRQQPASW